MAVMTVMAVIYPNPFYLYILHCFDVANIADVPIVHAASIFRAKDSRKSGSLYVCIQFGATDTDWNVK
jgi:hypothetical protein